MSGINKAILVGNLGKEPEVFTFENGNKQVRFSMATSETYKAKDGSKVEKTEWHNIVMYRGLASIAEQFLHKGSQVYIEGAIRTRSWETEGKKHYITEIEAREMRLLDKKKDNSGVTQGVPVLPTPPAEDENLDISDDDLPF